MMSRMLTILFLFVTTIGYSQVTDQEKQIEKLRIQLTKVIKERGDEEELGRLIKVDLNIDDQDEIVTYIGNDDYFLTRIYDQNFKEIHRCKIAYSEVLDLDEDGVPELLEPVFTKEFLDPIDCKFCNINGYSIMSDYLESNLFSYYNHPNYKEVIKKVNIDYATGRYDLFINMPIRILQYENGQFVDKTANYPKYLNWRIDILKALKKMESKETGKKILDAVIKKLEAYLN